MVNNVDRTGRIERFSCISTRILGKSYYCFCGLDVITALGIISLAGSITDEVLATCKSGGGGVLIALED